MTDTPEVPINPDDLLGEILDAADDQTNLYLDEETGEMVMTLRDDAPAAPPADADKETADKAESQPQPPQPEVVPAKDYKELQGEFTKRSQELVELRERLARLEGAAQATKPGEDAESESEMDWEMLRDDPQATVTAMRDIAAKEARQIKEALAPIVADYRARMEFQQLASDHDDLADVLPRMQEVRNQLPENLRDEYTLQGLYDLAKQFPASTSQPVDSTPDEGVGAQPEASPPPVEPTAPQVTADELNRLIQKANGLPSETGVGDGSPPQGGGPKRARTVEEAAEMALAELTSRAS